MDDMEEKDRVGDSPGVEKPEMSVCVYPPKCMSERCRPVTGVSVTVTTLIIRGRPECLLQGIVGRAPDWKMTRTGKRGPEQGQGASLEW